MLNYDFKILHSNEFECFTRDLLQESEGLRIESFAEGRDGGIDLRFAYDKSKKCIVQCKRYQSWRELKGSLKKEVSKVKKLNPDRYILSTSVDLTAANKDEIKNLFAPYIKDTAKDILGKSDLNNLLGFHSDIEKRYYKLWLGSTNVLNHILQKNIINWSEFEREEIQSEIGRYVQNESFNKAKKIIQEYRYLIISGIPGIGKTTLARMLVYNFLARDYDEFVYVVDDLDNAVKMFDKDKKQVFFFDDFLGSNTFIREEISFENKLISFINRVKKSKHTIFIMTTREYILSSAKFYYEKFDLNNIEIAKCTIDLTHYTKTVRAQILYNHLAEAELPKVYIDTLVKDKNYMKLVDHKNFNPRVIEGFIKKRIWNSIPAEVFMKTVLDYFDKPLAVCEKAFLNLDISARFALLVFATLADNYAYYDEWQEAYKYFTESTFKELHLFYEDASWRASVKILQDCFVKIDMVSEAQRVSPFNPSIMDYCVSYINENKTTLAWLLKSALYPEQITKLFTDSVNNNEATGWQVEVSPELFDLVNNSINRIRKNLYSENHPSLKRRSDTQFCVDLLKRFPIYCSSHEDFIEKNYDFEELLNANIYSISRFELMRELDWGFTSMKPLEILHDIAKNEFLDSYDWLEYAETVKALGLSDGLDDTSIMSIMEEQLKETIDAIEVSTDCEGEQDIIKNLSKKLPDWNNHSIIQYLSEREAYLSEEEESWLHDGFDYYDYYDYENRNQSENTSIHEMFTSLYDDSISD